MTATIVILACSLDALLGDPRWLPHPVRLIGMIITRYEEWVRSWGLGYRGEYAAGAVLALGVPSLCWLGTWGLLVLAAAAHPALEVAFGAVLAWTTLAARDLADHVRVVQRALEAGALDRARQAVARIVGRDTAHLSEEGVVRATTETVAESTADGFVAPLFYLTLGGPPLALAYKAVSTLDSMVGHRDCRYQRFGWASARLDDLANWIPSRVTAWLFVPAAGFVSCRLGAVRRAGAILVRDGHKHPSPNSGRPEAAMAGALGVRLGGTNVYRGHEEVRPYLGDPLSPLTPTVVDQAVRLMWTVVVLALVVSVTGLAL